ncbi:MAG TPA: DinB family protein [Candidatus Kapabacteria bacterium]|jgi:hypothetical protein|nr:DinB family protein [Candidatus Kapabacteria bacterium]
MNSSPLQNGGLAFGADLHAENLPATLEDVPELKRKYSSLLIQLDRLRSGLLSADLHYRNTDSVAPEDGAQAWSILEILGHLIDADRDIWWPRIKSIQQNDRPYLPDIDQQALIRKHNWQALPLDDVLGQLMRIRWNHAMNLNNIPIESFERTGEHATLGEINILRILELLVAHDAHYLEKIESLIDETSQSPL